jgi:hypothetical protein
MIDIAGPFYAICMSAIGVLEGGAGEGCLRFASGELFGKGNLWYSVTAGDGVFGAISAFLLSATHSGGRVIYKSE